MQMRRVMGWRSESVGDAFWADTLGKRKPGLDGHAQ